MQNSNPNNQLKNAPIYKIFGGGMDENEGNTQIEKANKEIEILENELAIKL